MPEAAVDEYGYPCTGEDHICRAPEAGNGSQVNPVPQAEAVERSAQRKLGGRVLAALCAHSPLGGLGGRERRSPPLGHRPSVLPLARRRGPGIWCRAVGSADVATMLEELLRGLVAGTVEPETDAPAEAKPWLDDLSSRPDTYRDAALMALAFAVDQETASQITTPPPGRRSVGQRLAELLDELNIRARRDAFQTVAKGTSSLLGRDRQPWNKLLMWAQAQEQIEPIELAMRYMATRIAATARNLPQMPALDVGRLTFRRMARVADQLLAVPSGGAHEQFLFASLLHALADEYGGRRVETKALSASDASSGSAADVQVLDGGKVSEAYEVTANTWVSKIGQATGILRQYDLPRVHIVAPGPAPTAHEIRDSVAAAPLPAGLIAGAIDLSVLDIQDECRSLIHRLSRPGRRTALNKLWEHLALRQPNDDLVAGYVTLLQSGGLVAES